MHNLLLNGKQLSKVICLGGAPTIVFFPKEGISGKLEVDSI